VLFSIQAYANVNSVDKIAFEPLCSILFFNQVLFCEHFLIDRAFLSQAFITSPFDSQFPSRNGIIRVSTS
jgi:hypothetical protein